MTLSKVLLSEESVVASEQPLASLAGYEVLRRGGNAVDAAVATSFSLAVTLPQCCGLGGDFFATVYDAGTGRVRCINSSGWAPSGLTLELLRSKGERGIPTFGHSSAVIPGFVAGVWAMHKRLGSLDFGKLLVSSSRLARRGFPASEGLSRSADANSRFLTRKAQEVFGVRWGGGTGGWVRQPELARVIDEVAESGPDAFYGGRPAEEIRTELVGAGIASKAMDFSDFKPEWVEPLSLNYRGTTVYEVPPNSMGATTLLMLKFLSERDMAKTNPLSRDRISFTMEAAELAYGRRDEMLGDPRFGRIDMAKFMKVGPAQKIRSRSVREGDTTAFAVADSSGNIVSGIQSLFHHFGSRVYVEECGVMLNNRGASFSTSGPNRLEPRKRPLHTLSSLILERDGTPEVAIGCSGGDYRPMQHVLFVTNMVDYSMPLEKAIDHPRFLRSDRKTMLAEEGYEGLESTPYDVKILPHPGGTGVCQGVEVLKRGRKGVCDVRGDGVPAGF